MSEPRMRKFLLPFMAIAALSAAACNTVAGAGQDLENAGDAVTETARDVQQDLKEEDETNTTAPPPPPQ
jgi:entericidin B